MPEINDEILAQNYGFSMALLNSSPELRSLFDQAVAGTWDQARFTAALRATQWFQTQSDQYRNVQALRLTDPTTWQKNFNQMRARVIMLASEMGAALPSADSVAEQAYAFGWDDNQLRQHFAQYIQYTDGRLIGQAGQWETELREWASDNGLTLSDAWYREHIQNATAGYQTINDVKKAMSQMAVSAYPHLADRIAAGETVASVAEPYRQAMAQLLEVNPNSVTLQDPTIRKALASPDKDGKPQLRTLYDFENDLRSDSRWLKTKNAQDQGQSVVNRVLQDFGIR